jgi:hypothetical protein
MPEYTWKCPSCGEKNPPYTAVCRNCQNEATNEVAQVPVGRNTGALLIAALALAPFLFFIFIGFLTRQ